MKNLISFLLLTLFCQVIYSQLEENEKVEELYYEGNQYILSEEHIEALPSFLELNKIAPSANIRYKLGECYLNINGQKDKSISYLESAVQSSSSIYDPASPYEKKAPLRAWYLLGKAYRINNEPDKAILALETLLDSLNGDEPEVVEQIEWEIEVNEAAKIFMESPISLTKENVGDIINNNFSNYNPAVTASEGTIFYMEALKFYDAIMVAEKDDNGTISTDNLTPKLRSDGDNYLTWASSEGDKLLFTYYDIFTKGDIYQGIKKDGKWEKLEKLGDNINSNYDETHASISSDGKTLYFTSNRPGGFGALDIYKSELNDDGEWGVAVNLGGAINSYKNENTPFITNDGKTLFFASENYYNMGGYDIFKSRTQSDNSWSKPKNLGYPINSTDDDLFFFPVNNGKTGYLAIFNDSEGFGSNDIYRITNFSEPELRKFTLNGSINIEDKNITDEDVSVVIESEGNKIAEPQIKDRNFSVRVKEGEYDVSVEVDGYDKSTVAVELDDDQDKLKIPLDFQLTKIDETISASIDTIILRNIYFMFDRYSLSSENLKYLSDLAVEIKDYDLDWQIDGYTDTKGAETYNLHLSKLRAKAVKKYLEKLGVDADNIHINAYGEKNPIAKEQTSEGADLPEGRKYNRRVEIRFENTPEGIILIKESNIPKHLLK